MINNNPLFTFINSVPCPCSSRSVLYLLLSVQAGIIQISLDESRDAALHIDDGGSSDLQLQGDEYVTGRHPCPLQLQPHRPTNLQADILHHLNRLIGSRDICVVLATAGRMLLFACPTAPYYTSFWIDLSCREVIYLP